MIEKMETVLPVTDELLADSLAYRDEPVPEWLRERMRVKMLENSLPRHVRFWRLHVKPRVWIAQERLQHAVRALRGQDCEGW